MSLVTVTDAGSVPWDREADVVVVGFGGAGACAALQAREAGADVLLIDRFGGGGTTSYSGGVFYAGATRFQKAAGFDDTVESMYAYLELEVGEAVHPETLRRFCEGSAADLDWLIDHGVKYDSAAYLEKVTYPPEGKYLYYSGNEKSPAFAQRAPPAPRGHRAVGPGFGGAHYIAALRQAIGVNGIELVSHARVTDLILDKTGAVVGVQVLELPKERHAEEQRLYGKVSPFVPHNHGRTRRVLRAIAAMEKRDGRRRLVRARGGVVLSTGGFAYDRALIERHDPQFAHHYDKMQRLSTMGSDGSGLKMAVEAGAAVGSMNSFYIARNIAPPEALLAGILVNGRGERFVPEDAYVSLIGGEIVRQPDGDAWLLVNGPCFRRSVVEAVTCGWQRFTYFGLPMLVNFALGGTRCGRNAASLARKLGGPPERLAATLAHHDADIRDGRPDLVGKNEVLRKPLGEGPLWAINMSMGNRHAMTKFMTLGGLKVDEESGAVIRENGGQIPGLYAAGMSAVGLHSNGYISGLSLADGVFSGRRAGRSAAARQASSGQTLKLTGTA
jgi:3-oxo-5alpha-steroid 4-dehydrogenase